MLTILLTSLPVFLMIAAGYAAAKAGLLAPDAASILNRFVVWIPLPCLMFDVVATTDWARLWNTGYVLASLGGAIAAFVMGLVVGRMRGLDLGDMAVDGLNASYANCTYLGLPLLALLLGPESRPLVVLAGSVMLMALFGAGVLLIELCGSKGHGPMAAMFRVGRGLVGNPVLLAPALGALWWWSGLVLPETAKRFIELLGGATSPTALVAIGLFLAARPLAQAIDRSVMMLTAIKLIVMPAVTAWLAWSILDLPSNIARIAILVAALPTGTGPFMIAEFYARDGRVTSGTILVTVLLSVLSVAAIMAWTA